MYVGSSPTGSTKGSQKKFYFVHRFESDILRQFYWRISVVVNTSAYQADLENPDFFNFSFLFYALVAQMEDGTRLRILTVRVRISSGVQFAVVTQW